MGEMQVFGMGESLENGNVMPIVRALSAGIKYLFAFKPDLFWCGHCHFSVIPLRNPERACARKHHRQ
jgi:hypothetical protein